jgi:hypothetical protein
VKSLGEVGLEYTRKVMNWIRENQPLINFGLLVGAIVYTIITGFILRMSARQLRTMVQPALTLKGPFTNSRQPALELGSLWFQNRGPGTALNVVIRVTVHQRTARGLSPKLDTETTNLPNAIEAGAAFCLPSLHTAVEAGQGPTGNMLYKLLHEYEVFVSYSSIAGAKYLTHLSVGMAGTIDSSYVGEGSASHRAHIWAGILWRYHRQRVSLKRKLSRGVQ